MDREKVIMYLETLKEEYYDSEVGQAIDVAKTVLEDRNIYLHKLLKRIKKLHDEETKEVEKLNDNKDFHLAVRRGIILCEQIIEDELKSK